MGKKKGGEIKKTRRVVLEEQGERDKDNVIGRLV
jgi:hypothetical protein